MGQVNMVAIMSHLKISGIKSLYFDIPHIEGRSAGFSFDFSICKCMLYDGGCVHAGACV